MELPLRAYNRLVAKCAASSPVYRVLLRTRVIRRAKGNQSEILIVEIECDVYEAKLLIEFAETVDPEIARDVRRSFYSQRTG